jgi:hypothetical protein
MSITEAVRLQVRQRANFVCEFCGVTETDTGGELTIDHFCLHQQQTALLEEQRALLEEQRTLLTLLLKQRE